MTTTALSAPAPVWAIARLHYPKASGHYAVSRHARRRMRDRGLAPQVVRDALTYGRVVYARGAAIFVLGRKEVGRYADALDRATHDGVQVVVSRIGHGTVQTVYRNRRDLPRA